MNNQTVNIIFEISGNANQVMNGVTQASAQLSQSLNRNINIFNGFKGNLVVIQQATQWIQGLNSSLDAAIQPGIQLNNSLQDLSAITGITGKGLKEIEGYARESAKAFGIDAAGAVEGYKLVLSQLSPGIAKTPVALKAMGASISTLSKTMGGDTTAAAEVLTTAMNQFQVATDDPIAASKEMARMMNVMAAGAKEGSAELPQIKQALEQAGMAAKGAGVSFEETNAAIQVLDKAGKKGSEGGVALRNVMNILSRGRFLPEDVQEELQAAGVDINALTDKSKTLTERLKPLQSVMNDSALFSKLFGMENTNAAIALVQGIDEVDRYTAAITGTNTAYEQAKTVMESYAEKQARIKAQFDNLKISVFNATGDFGIWTQVLASAMIPLAQLMPLFIGVGNVINLVKIKWGKFVNKVNKDVPGVNIKLLSLIPSTVGIGIGFQVMSVMAKGACRAIGIAIMNIPIVGWIAAAIAAVIAVVQLLWNKCEGFRRLVMGVWESIKAVFHNVWIVIKAVFDIIWNNILKPYFTMWKNIFVGIWNAVKWCVDQIVAGVTWLYDQVVSIASSIGDFFVGIWNWVTETVSNAFNWIIEKLGSVGKWIKEKLVEPIKNAFVGIWTTVKDVFDKILNKLGKLFKPIKELWNKIFPKDQFKDVGDAYAEGAKKGSESFKKNQEEKANEEKVIEGATSSAGTSVLGTKKPAKSPTADFSGNLSGGKLGSSAGQSAGKAQQINITFKSMVETMNFQCGLRENARDVEAQLTESLARILGMAETSS
ncbi:MAG: phage tail tape measure protein [Bacteroidales bacterium]|nr:phage tail tape measure protein [Bacteroidales bacterium]